MPEPRADVVHLTAPQPHAPERQSAWPPVIGAGVVLLAVGVTVSLPVAAVGVLVLVGGVAGVAFEVRRESRRGEESVHDPPVRPQDVWGRRPKQWWLAAGFAVSTTMLFVAILRAFDAHGLFDPANWPPPARELHGALPAAAATALLAGAVAATRSARAARRETPGSSTAAAVALALAALFLAWRVAEWRSLLDAGFHPLASVAAAGFYALTATHAVVLVGAWLQLAVAGAAASRGRVGEREKGSLEGAALYVTYVAVAWLVIYALVYLRVVTHGGSTLLHG